MNVGSLFSGCGGMDYGLSQAGHRHAFFCESDPWRRDVLAHHWPGVPIYDDVRAVGVEPTPRTQVDGGVAVADGAGRLHTDTVPDLLAGGFPCQDVSVAGRRAGLAGGRSGLFFEFARVIDAFRPGWVLVENVPGLLSSNGGRDFGAVVGTLADIGYGVAWRILDSRFFGVPQRRRRVFIVGARADGDPAAAARRAGQILAVGSRCPWHPPTGTEAGPDVAVASLSGLGNGGPDDNDGQAGRLVTSPLLSNKRSGYRFDAHETGQLVATPLTKGSSGAGVSAPGRRQEDDVNLVAYALRKNPGGIGQGHNTNFVAGPLGGGNDGIGRRSEDDPNLVAQIGVRRLTPTECERLQALPDGWTLLDDSTPDSRRYSALGDAVTASVAEWIGRRLASPVLQAAMPQPGKGFGPAPEGPA